MRRLASQPRNVQHGIPRRMRAQHQTKMTVHVRKSNRGMNNQSKQAKQQKPPSPRLLRPPLHHLSRPKSRQPGTATSDIVSYSTAAAIPLGRLRAPGLSSLCSPTSCFVPDCSSMRPQRPCCTALRFFTLATPKHGSISASPHCCCSLPQA